MRRCCVRLVAAPGDACVIPAADVVAVAAWMVNMVGSIVARNQPTGRRGVSEFHRLGLDLCQKSKSLFALCYNVCLS